MGNGTRHGVECLPVYGGLPGKVKNPCYAAHAKRSLLCSKTAGKMTAALIAAPCSHSGDFAGILNNIS
jgi:hypothetical protein